MGIQRLWILGFFMVQGISAILGVCFLKWFDSIKKYLNYKYHPSDCFFNFNELSVISVLNHYIATKRTFFILTDLENLGDF